VDCRASLDKRQHCLGDWLSSDEVPRRRQESWDRHYCPNTGAYQTQLLFCRYLFANHDQLDERYFLGFEGQYTFALHFLLQEENSKPGEHICRVRPVHEWENRSVSCEVHLEPGKYEVVPKITATRQADKKMVEDVIKDWAEKNPQKLRQVGMQYDLAHAKGGVADEDLAIVTKQDEEKKKKEDKKKKEAEKKKKAKEKRRRERREQKAKERKEKEEQARREKEEKEKEEKEKKEKDDAEAKAKMEEVKPAEVDKTDSEKKDAPKPESQEADKADPTTAASTTSSSTTTDAKIDTPAESPTESKAAEPTESKEPEKPAESKEATESKPTETGESTATKESKSDDPPVAEEDDSDESSDEEEVKEEERPVDTPEDDAPPPWNAVSFPTSSKQPPSPSPLFVSASYWKRETNSVTGSPLRSASSP